MLANLPEDFDKSKITVLGTRRRKSDRVIRVSDSDFRHISVRKFRGYFALKKGKCCNSAPREVVAELALETGESISIINAKDSTSFACVYVRKAFLDGEYVVVQIEDI